MAEDDDLLRSLTLIGSILGLMIILTAILITHYNSEAILNNIKPSITRVAGMYLFVIGAFVWPLFMMGMFLKIGVNRYTNSVIALAAIMAIQIFSGLAALGSELWYYAAPSGFRMAWVNITVTATFAWLVYLIRYVIKNINRFKEDGSNTGLGKVLLGFVVFSVPIFCVFALLMRYWR